MRSGELEAARARREKLLSEVRGSALKQEAVSLYEQMSELETRRETLERDLREHRTPAEEREHLLAQVRSDNQEIALLERQQQEANARTETLQDQLRNIEQEADEALQLGTRASTYFCEHLSAPTYTRDVAACSSHRAQ